MDLEQEQWWNAYQKDENADLLDVRTEEEVMPGRIPNALHYDF